LSLFIIISLPVTVPKALIKSESLPNLSAISFLVSSVNFKPYKSECFLAKAILAWYFSSATTSLTSAIVASSPDNLTIVLAASCFAWAFLPIPV